MPKSAVVMPTKTREVAELLGVNYFRLLAAMRSGKMSLPCKDSSGDFVWSQADVEAARKALAVDRRRKAKVAS